ncbi:MAG: hypothetical protein ACLTZM_20660 [Ruminococcus sp.]
MTVSEAQKKASKKYFDTNYKQVKLSMPNTEAEALENHSKEFHYDSKAGFIRTAIKEKMDRDHRTISNLKIGLCPFLCSLIYWYYYTFCLILLFTFWIKCGLKLYWY